MKVGNLGSTNSGYDLKQNKCIKIGKDKFSGLNSDAVGGQKCALINGSLNRNHFPLRLNQYDFEETKEAPIIDIRDVTPDRLGLAVDVNYNDLNNLEAGDNFQVNNPIQPTQTHANRGVVTSSSSSKCFDLKTCCILMPCWTIVGFVLGSFIVALINGQTVFQK